MNTSIILTITLAALAGLFQALHEERTHYGEKTAWSRLLSHRYPIVGAIARYMMRGSDDRWYRNGPIYNAPLDIINDGYHLTKTLQFICLILAGASSPFGFGDWLSNIYTVLLVWVGAGSAFQVTYHSWLRPLRERE